MNPTYPPGYLAYGSIQAGDTLSLNCPFCLKEYVGKRGALACDDCKAKHAGDLAEQRKERDRKLKRRSRAKQWLAVRAAELRGAR